MEQNNIFIGVDVSKSTLDICIIHQETSISTQIANKVVDIRKLFKKYYGTKAKVYVGVENTGYYNWKLYKAIEDSDVILFVIPPLHLKKSLGLTRGKTDKIDAIRIAEFIKLRYIQLSPTLIPRKQLRALQALSAQRSRLVKTKRQLSTALSEACEHVDPEVIKILKQANENVIKKIDQSTKLIESKIEQLIASDPNLKEKYEYVTSVQGVGKVLAWSLLVKTNEFLAINNPRKLACYAGVVPFDHQSGVSIRKKPRVSFMADKDLKKLLHMAAMRAIQLKGDLRDYYLRRVLDGKNKMSVLNAVRNKLVARICAVINNKRNYVPDLLLS